MTGYLTCCQHVSLLGFEVLRALHVLAIVPAKGQLLKAQRRSCGQELTASPTIDDIVHYDSWARDWTAAHATSFQDRKQVVLQ